MPHFEPSDQYQLKSKSYKNNMFETKYLQRQPVKIILICLIILEVAVIAYSYSIAFDNYITFVVILLALLISYFTFRHLSYSVLRSTTTFQAMIQASKPSEVDDLTRRQVDKLIDSPQYKEYERKKAAQSRRIRQSEEQQAQQLAKEEDKTEGVMEQLVQMEETIFNL